MTRDDLHEAAAALLSKCFEELDKRTKLPDGTTCLPWLSDGESKACRFIIASYKATLVEAMPVGSAPPMPDLPQDALSPGVISLGDVTPDDLRRLRVA